MKKLEKERCNFLKSFTSMMNESGESFVLLSVSEDGKSCYTAFSSYNTDHLKFMLNELTIAGNREIKNALKGVTNG